MTVKMAQSLLEAYGSAIRGSWGGIDGRRVRSCLNKISLIMAEDESVDRDYAATCREFGVCPDCSQWLEDTCYCPEEEKDE